jgi:hypothetical protein
VGLQNPTKQQFPIGVLSACLHKMATPVTNAASIKQRGSLLEKVREGGGLEMNCLLAAALRQTAGVRWMRV